jgi:hypothetical protein
MKLRKESDLGETILPIPRKLSVLLALVAILFLTLQVCETRAAGYTYVDYFETDKTTYEVGQNVNATAGYWVVYDYYGRSIEYSWVQIFLTNGSSCLASDQWLNESDGYHMHQSLFLLNPSFWNPGQGGETGTVECSASMEPDGGYGYCIRNIRVVRARQNCTLIRVLPSYPSANATEVSLFLRAYNANNSSFGVASNRIYFNITNPYGQFAITNGSCLSETDGEFMVSFEPSFVYGTYHVSLLSVESGEYLEGRFNYTLNVERSPIPTNLTVQWNYAGNMYNSSTSYALEPIQVTARLTDSLHGVGISDQQLNITLLDSSNMETVCKMQGTTNSSGIVTSTLTVPYEGEFTLTTNYQGLSTAWISAFETSPDLVKTTSRGLSIVGLMPIPATITLNHSYPVKYLILDSLSKKPVPNAEVAVETDNSILASGTTDGYGEAEFTLYLPCDRLDLVGNTSLIVEASLSSSRQIFHACIMNASIFCKIPTLIRLETSPQNVLEVGETVVITTELFSSDSAPLPGQRITLVILIDQEESPYDTILMATGSQGTCSFSLILPDRGVVTVIAKFDGNSTFDSSNSTYSLSILPTFQERLSASTTSVLFTALISTILLLTVERVRRKVRWQDVSIT